MSGEPLGLAVIGVGRMGRFHANALAGCEAVNLLAVADGAEEALAATSADLGSVATYDSLAQAAEHPGVEACLIATSTPTHPTLVRQALDHGLHVLCEKPVALDPSEGRELAAEATEAGLVLQVGHWRRFSPPWVAMRQAIIDGRIGRPLILRLAQWDADPPPPAFCDPRVSGGLAVDCGVHEYDLAEWLTGARIEEVVAHPLPLVDESLAEVGDVDNLVVVLRLDDGSIATVDLTRNARYGDDVRTEVLGSDGALFVDILPTGRARLATGEGIGVLPGSETDDATSAGVIAQAMAFATLVRGAEVDYPDALDSVRATEVGLAVIRSGASGRPERVTP
ncbi:MAG: Gfo/Idh/MocA family oxidoreductase [Actinomycetia bacterium]|nr:Gfo/Idh/MocA family oxidoreductase [Actinomycetes bacterium]